MSHKTSKIIRERNYNAFKIQTETAFYYKNTTKSCGELTSVDSDLLLMPGQTKLAHEKIQLKVHKTFLSLKTLFKISMQFSIIVVLLTIYSYCQTYPKLTITLTLFQLST